MNISKPISLFMPLFILLACLSFYVTSGVAQEPAPFNPGAHDANNNVYMPLIVGKSSPQEWSTVAGNLQRTSWIPEEVRGDIPLGGYHVIWYHPIEAYISQNFQLITSNGVVYVPTAKGLYALDANTGNLKWRFDTELPIGNSPTVTDGIVYVGGYDHKIHALDAATGTHLWSFDGAQAGYSANPLVVNGMVIAANRDGVVYAIGANGTSMQGQLLWKFRAGGPIEISPAYKDGVLYFAALDNYAYAVNASNGAQIWKSQKLPGDGYGSYWPVIYTNPQNNQTVVIFSGNSSYRAGVAPGTGSILCRSYSTNDPNLYPCDSIRFYSEDLFYGLSTDTLGPTVTLNESWAQGKTIVNYSRVTEYYENNPSPDAHLHKPWRRYYTILNANNGSEYTFDSDRDGYGEYAPIIPFSTNAGNVYPPVVGKDNLLYFSNLYFRSGQGRVMGWKFGTPYLALSVNQGSIDEPQALSAGGNLIFRSICCDRVGDWFDSSTSSTIGRIWHYDNPLSTQAPGYDPMWWFLADPTALARLYGNYGNVNGIYHNHGDQNPIISHQGKYFVHRSNAVIAFGSGQSYGKLPKLTFNQTIKDTPIVPTEADLKARLEAEVQKIISAGFLKPGYYNAGQFQFGYPELAEYFINPGDTLYTLARAYPYLSPALQQQTQTYLRNEFQTYFDPVMYARIGWVDGISRQAMDLPPEVLNDLSNYPKSTWAGYGWNWQYPQNNFYAMWKYAQIFPQDAARIYELAKSKIEVPVTSTYPISIDEWFARHPWEVNGYIAGYTGFLRLQEMAGKTVVDAQLRSTVTNELNRLLQYRVTTFSKDTYYNSYNRGQVFRSLNVARNFMLLVPELGDYLRANALTKVQTAINEYNYVGPYWFVSRYNGAIGESAMQHLYDYPAIFQARAYILKEPRNELIKYLDAPAFEIGDLYYIQNLVAAIEAP